MATENNTRPTGIRDEKTALIALEKAEKKIQRLTELDRQHKLFQKELQKRTLELKERVKELNCLYTISAIIETKGATLDEILQRTVDIIPDAWQYPDITSGRIILNDRVFTSRNFEKTKWKQSQNIIVHGSPAGSLEVFYHEKRPKADEGPFLKEERTLINGIAERMGQMVEVRFAEEALKESESQNRALLEAIPDLMFQVDSSGILLGLHVGSFSSLKKFSREFIGSSVYDISDKKKLLPRRLLEQAMAYVAQSLSTGRAQVYERHLSLGGDVSDIEVRIVMSGPNKALGIVRDTTRRKKLERELLEISGREQRRIGQDLHDSLCQHLAGIGFMSKVLERKTTAKQPIRSEDIIEIVELIDQAITLTRGFARGLNPVRLEADGLMMALIELASNVEKLFGVACRFECEKPVLLTDNAVASHVYRIAQEALNNAIKHGKADTITITLRQDDGSCILTIHDNGVGIGSTTSQGKGMGLSIMQYRASMIGAALDIRTHDIGGTIIRCVFSNRAPDRRPESVQNGGYL
jgi:signal transduction histidine kinase